MSEPTEIPEDDGSEGVDDLQITEDDLLGQIEDNSPAARHARRKLRAAKAQAEASVAEAQLAVKDALALLLDSQLCKNMYPSLVALNQAIRIVRIALLQVLTNNYEVSQAQATADAVLFLAEQDAAKTPTGALALRSKLRRETLALLLALGRVAGEQDPDAEPELIINDNSRGENPGTSPGGTAAGEGRSERTDAPGGPAAGEQSAAETQ